VLILLFCGYVYGAAFCTFMYDFIINIYWVQIKDNVVFHPVHQIAADGAKFMSTIASLFRQEQ